MSEHIVKSFDDELTQLKTRLVQMGGMAENALDQAIAALSTCDIELADTIAAFLPVTMFHQRLLNAFATRPYRPLGQRALPIARGSPPAPLWLHYAVR
jgi:hypothetical protein